ncbi:MAG: polyphenol oxidase family protein [Thermodesulfobacteriota bacterium]
MLHETAQAPPLLRFASLAGLPGIVHAVTTKAGGVSVGAFAGLNLGAAVGDDPAAVARNLQIVREALGLKRLVWAKQVHGAELVAVEDGSAGAVGTADGLATDQPGVGLLIKQADCQAVVLAAPARGVVANLHAGWRGNLLGMARRGVEFLRERYGVRPEEIHAAVSPSLGPCCAEFVHWRRELGPAFAPYQVGANHFDLWRVSVDQLTAAGVPAGQIEVSGLCTKCGAEFFSYRREGLTGRFGTVVALA